MSRKTNVHEAKLLCCLASRERPDCYPDRAPVAHANWDDVAPEYTPNEFTHKVVIDNAENRATGNKWADVDNPSPSQLGKRKTFVGGNGIVNIETSSCHYDTKRRRYLFPGGRTGLVGRGLLGRFGPNHAADPIVTRYRDGKLEVVLVTRNDGSNQLAFPGGMVEPGATHTQTLKAEFTEEACQPGGAVDRLFSECEEDVVYQGVVDDWRTTDEAWIETIAVHFHAPSDIADALDLCVTDTAEVKKVAWYEAAAVTEMYAYASHASWLCAVIRKMDSRGRVSSRTRSAASYPFARR